MTAFDPFSVTVHVDARREELLVEAARERLVRHARQRRGRQRRHSVQRATEC